MSFWENQLQKVKEGKSPALTIEQQQEREKPELAMQENKPVEQAAQTDDGVGFGDVAKAAASGVVGWAESNAEIALTPESRKAVSATVPGMLLGLADYVPVIRDTLVNAKRQTQEQFAETKQGIKTSMSASARKALEAELINDNLEFTDDATKLSTWIMKGTETIARMVPDLVAGGLVGKELYQSSYDLAFQNGMAKGLTETGAKIAANKIANAAMMAPTAIASTMSSQGSAGVQVRQTIENLPWKDLAQSDTFKQSFAQINADPANAEMSNKDKLNLARTMTAETASKDIIDDPALLTVNALASFIGDATLGKMIAGKMSGGIASKVIKGAVAEGATEAPQGAMEQYAQNLTLIDIAGQDIAPSKGVAKSAAEGGLMGAVIGGGMGGGSGAVDAFTGRPSEGAPTETIPTEDVAAEADIAPTEEKPVSQRREELEQKLDQQREEARKERVISGEGEAQQALAAGKVSPTAEELIQAAPSQPKETPMEYGLNRATIMQKEMDEFIQGRKAPTVAERRANLEKRLEQQRAEMDRQRVETGTGEVQARLSRPAEPTAEELILKAPEESGPTPGELEFRQQSEQNYIEKAKDAKIPPGLKGRPNAVKLMNVGYRNALSDFGGLSERMAKNTGPSAEVDTMSDAIAKMGGLSRKVAETEGFDPSAIKGNKTFSAKGKLGFDSAASKLNDLGFENRQGKPLSGNDVIDMIYGEANNAEAHYSKQALPEMMTGDARLTKVWTEQIGGADKLNVAVKKALNNEPLGKRQADVIEDMLDTINTMRTESVGKAKEKLSQIRAERSNKRVSDFNKLMSDATGESDHLQDAQSYADVISEMPDNYTEEQVILDELVSTAGDADFESTKGAIEQYDAGTVSLPNLLTQLGDIAKKRVKTNAETKPAIQEISEPTAPAVEAVVTERVEPSPTAPAVEPVAERADAGTERTEPVTEKAAPEVKKQKEKLSKGKISINEAKEMGFDTNRILYHGTPSEIDEFDVSKTKDGIHLFSFKGEDVEFYATGSEGRVIPVYVKYDNPLVIDENSSDEYGISMPEEKENLVDSLDMTDGDLYARASEDGNDAIVLNSEDGEQLVVILKSENIIKVSDVLKPKSKSVAPPSKSNDQEEAPPILEVTKAKWVQGEVKKKGIKKGSPGYDDALAKINDSYENEVDKALALSTFEAYQKFNSDTPESINRMAYDELRKEFGTDEANKVSFDKSSIVTGTKKGMPLKEVDLVSKAFLKEYKGAAGAKVVVFKTQQEAMDYVGVPMDDDVTISGMHIPMSNEVVLIADNLDSPSDALKTLRHEILAHHGLLKVVGQNEWEAVTDLVSASRNASSLKDVWAEIDRNYEGTSESRKAEEVIAKIAEESPGKFGEWGNRIVAAVIRALRRVRFIRDKITDTEIKDMIRIIGERMKNLSVAEARIRNDINFSRQNNGSTLKDNEVAVTHSGGKIDEINKGGIFSGLFASYGEESYAGVNLDGNQTTFAINKDKIASAGDRDLDYKSSIAFLKKQYPDFNQDQIDTLYEWVAEDAADPWSDNILENEGYDDPGEASWEAQRLRGQLAIDQGFDAVEMKDETGISILIPYGSKARIINRGYSLPDEKVNFRRRANNDPWAAENKKLREEDKTLWQQGQNILKRNLTPEGLLPNEVFNEKIKRDSEFEAVEFTARVLVGDFDKAIMKAYKMSFDYLPQATKNKLNEALSGRIANDIAPEVKASIIAMRQSIDGLSGEYINNIMDKMANEMAVNGRVSAADEALLTRISDNIGAYVNRSYKAFDDPKWFKKVPVETVNAARDYFVQRYIDDGETESEAKRLSDIVVNEILKTGTAYDSMESFIAEGKLGAKDLSILMRKKVIDPEIRALLGEYDDPRINYVKSATKMGRLVWNERFLNRVLDIGMGSFLFKGKDRPANATKQIAGDQSETYSPLNGLWTFPEVEQAFKDSMGREQMSDLMRFIVRANGAVKYGKTVLSPTTAMRNFQSAMFFALANGHFNLSKIKDAMAAVRVQVTDKATAADIGYFVKLKRLGVVYDAPYAKEMARLLGDSEVENMLSSKFGDGAMKSFTKLNDFAQSFYSFGDDFWKIVGFENEKASLLDAGMSASEAEMEAAKRIRNTYPTYSMTGKAIKSLSRFPLAGTFVSFPAEIVRTSINMIKTVNSDIKSSNPKMRALGYKRIAGMAFVSSAFFALNAATKAMLGVTDDEEEAIRDLAAPWQKNSTFAYVGRDEKNNLQYFDMSFLDPYGYFKRPITAMLRDQPWQDAAVSGLSDLISPFLGADIVAQSIFEVLANKKGTGSQVYNENGMPGEQIEDISLHLGKTVAPGFIGNAVRIYKALDGQVSSSGKPYKFEEEMLSLVGWRLSTMDPKTSLHYKTFEFSDGLKNANRTIMKQIQDVNKVSDDDLMSAYESAKKQHDIAFKKMIRLTSSAKNSGMTKAAIFETLKRSGVSDDNAKMVIVGKTPPFKLSRASAENAIKKAKVSIGSEHATRVRERVVKVMKQ